MDPIIVVVVDGSTFINRWLIIDFSIVTLPGSSDCRIMCMIHNDGFYFGLNNNIVDRRFNSIVIHSIQPNYISCLMYSRGGWIPHFITISRVIERVTNKHALNTSISDFGSSVRFDFNGANLAPCVQVLGKVGIFVTPMFLSGCFFIPDFDNH
jgi:hypothetical protein